MSLLQGIEHAFSFNFILCRELLMTVNISVQERNATNLASEGEFNTLVWNYICFSTLVCASQDGSKATVATM